MTETYKVRRDTPSTEIQSSAKYDAYIGKFTEDIYLKGYVNTYILLGTKQPVGIHLGYEGRHNLRGGDAVKHQNSFTVGIIGNITKKGDDKSLIGVVPYVKLSSTDKFNDFDFNNENNSEVGIKFNVPVRTLFVPS